MLLMLFTLLFLFFHPHDNSDDVHAFATGGQSAHHALAFRPSSLGTSSAHSAMAVTFDLSVLASSIELSLDGVRTSDLSRSPPAPRTPRTPPTPPTSNPLNDEARAPSPGVEGSQGHDFVSSKKLAEGTSLGLNDDAVLQFRISLLSGAHAGAHGGSARGSLAGESAQQSRLTSARPAGSGEAWVVVSGWRPGGASTAVSHQAEAEGAGWVELWRSAALTVASHAAGSVQASEAVSDVTVDISRYRQVRLEVCWWFFNLIINNIVGGWGEEVL